MNNMHKDAKKMPRTQIKNKRTDHLLDGLYSIMIPIYITQIAKVEFIDTGAVVKLNTNDKSVYGYLLGMGNTMGYNSIYPTVEQISKHLGITTRTVTNCLNKLETVKFIKRVKNKNTGKWENTHYWVYRPNLIDRVRWLGLDNEILTGSHYRFDPKQFKKSKVDLDKDRLLKGLVKLYEKG
jgi:predicted transcriptional regulator